MSAAWEAGLEEGDVITAVNGEPAHDLDVQGFVDRMTGPEGSEVEFTIAYPGDDGEPTDETVRVERRFIEG